jgi:hypothetical protein
VIVFVLFILFHRMESDIVLELCLYGALLVLLLIIRWWQNKKVSTITVRPLEVLKPVARPKRPQRKVSAVVPRASVDDLPWRKEPPPSERKSVKPDDKPVAITLSTVNPKPAKPVIDLRPAFNNDVRKLHVDPAITPPNSPCYSVEDYSRYGLDHSFDAFIVKRDTDFERRRNYIKKQVTDGEVMMEFFSTYRVCQIFVYGIEYHYIYDGNKTSWDLPDNLSHISDWFLKIPESRKRKFGSDPPIPLRHEPDPVPFFI